MKVYFYPPLFNKNKNKNKNIDNPYTKNFINSLKPYFSVNDKPSTMIGLLDFLHASLSSDIVILNWVDNIAHKKFAYLQYLLFRFVIKILMLRKVRIVWVFHNIHAHQGENLITKKINNIMLKRSDIIIVHSLEAQEYLSDKTLSQVEFCHHPIKNIVTQPFDNIEKINEVDFLIWGTIEPYKGVLEFVQFCFNNQDISSKWKVKIIGSCKNLMYEEEIKKYLCSNIIYENRKIEFNELLLQIRNSKFVLFPYTSTSVSSSGALMDSISMGANVIGPAKGAFLDLSKEKICNVFSNFCEIDGFYQNYNKSNLESIVKFIESNSWDQFANKLSLILKSKIKEKY
ncbi:hypothetical protein ACMYSL_10115 [Klebsiella sp. MISC125]|uniref:hypothetical protein n=1 Tax=Klebsiella sp. MISC125 TaxID=2755386 RepID=UPI003DA90C5C